MLKLTVLICIVAIVGVAQCHDWITFKEIHGKSYPNPLEEARRRAIFERRVKEIAEHNADVSQSYKKGINHMSDWTDEEYAALNGFKMPKGASRGMNSNSLEANAKLQSLLDRMKDEEIPDEHDWRKERDVVTSVKNQLQCGSCWAFATTGLLEGQERNRGVNFTSLSEQNLVDCSKENSGCNGGIMSEALRFVREQGGIDGEKFYPYEGRDGKCRFKKNRVVTTTGGSEIIGPNDEKLLKRLVYIYGPIAVAIAANENLQQYEGGIYDDADCGFDLNHGVLVVGYGVCKETKKDYWIVKNSWSSKWGEEGYVRMARNKDGQCGIAMQPTIAI